MRELSHPGVLVFPTSCCGVLFFLKCTPGVRDRLRTQLCHTQVCHRHNSLTHTHNFVTENFFTHHSFTHTHTQLCHTRTRTQTQLCHTELCHTHNSFTHKTLSQTALSQTTLSHTTFPHTTLSQLCHAHNFVTHLVTCTAGVALTALGWLWWRAWSPVASCDAAVFCIAGVALADMHAHFVWQEWHLVTCTSLLRSRRGILVTLMVLLCGRHGMCLH